jgi:thymidylate synthase ThyX
MTHRVFSRNASSSRAIPISTQIDKVERHPMYPVEWGQNKPGMQAGEPLTRADQTEAEDVWGLALMDAIKHARRLKEIGVHKQIVNRLLEPFSSITAIVTATDWDNFFQLRISPLAQPEIRTLAEMMKAAMDASTPISRGLNEWHLPFVTEEERMSVDYMSLVQYSAARCARVSYLNHDGMKPTPEKDIALAVRLAEDRHASVFEHQATPYWGQRPRHQANFLNWYSHRSMLGI